MKKTIKALELASYNPQIKENHWQNFWEKNRLFQSSAQKVLNEADKKNKLYLLFAFAYPSGSGLHVGHVESKTALDILARYYRMKGKQVFFPVGWDAFGLPAENYAIKTGIHPAETTKNAIETFKRQIKRLGISYDWGSEIATSHPEYYSWTQWLFLELFQKGLAYQSEGSVNWCSSCQTVLANEQVVEGKCERCSTLVRQKALKQWFFKITAYREELISGLAQVDWPKTTKQQQLNWIGKKEGINIEYKVVDSLGHECGQVTCFTTRPDTNFGATFIVLAPEHALAKKVAQTLPAVASYIEEATHKTELIRQQEGRKKTGVFTGLYALNQLNQKKMPIWVSDFVLGGFGTGAVVGVPGHDRRDFEFAQAFGLELIRVVVGNDGDKTPIRDIKQVQEETGVMTNSGFLDGLEISLATEKIMDYLESKGWGKRVTSYKLRDWLISRQRYWGAPIPIVYDPQGQAHPVKQEHLPWLLPTDVDFNPKGESPLKSSKEFIQRTEKLYGKGWRPEFDTMDTFVCSSWYYLRFTDARNKKQFASKKQLDQWLPVDFYMIGPEHIVLHLLYSRFFTKFLRDQGYLDFDEPFLKMRHQGMILGPDGKKMSKSKGNVINPDEIIEKFGADTLRVYEMFMGPIEADKPWDVRAVNGVYRFLNRIYDLFGANLKTKDLIVDDDALGDGALSVKLQQTLVKVDEDIKQLKFNTAIAKLMELVNLWEKTQTGFTGYELSILVKMIAPLAPFLAEELFFLLKQAGVILGGKMSVHLEDWPLANLDLAKQASLTLPVQVNGKVRGQLVIDQGSSSKQNQDKIFQMALKLPTVSKWISANKLKKSIYVECKIVSFVTD